MKKPKLRLDKAAIQEFFVQNVEKIVFGLLALVFLFLVYSAIVKVKPYDKTPKELENIAKLGQKKLDDAEPEKDLEVRDYDVQAQETITPIAQKPYGSLANWDMPIFPKRELRGSPALYAVQGLRGTAGVGAFQMVVQQAAAGADEGAAMGGPKVQGQRWVVLTASVPFDKQEQAFIDALKNAGPSGSYDAARDTPFYWGYEVQRVEVVSPGDEAKIDWEKAKTILSGAAVDAAVKQWGQQQNQEVVAIENLFQPNPNGLVFPLGSLVGSTWGESVAHPPEIPIQNVGGVGAGMGLGGRGRPILPPRGNAGQPFARPGMPAAGGIPGDDSEPDPFGGNPAEPAGVAPAEGAVAGAGASTYLLFRFFDFDVQPGKRYAYRVRLGLQNPNYKKLKINTVWLKDPKLAEERVLKTKWSDEEDAAPVVVSVPVDTGILAVSVTAKSRQPLGRILVSKWLRERGVEVSKEFDVVRGQVADFADEITKPTSDVPGARIGDGRPLRPMPLVPQPDGRGGFGGGGVGRDGRPILPTVPGTDGRMPVGPRGPLAPAAPEGDRPFYVNYFTHAIVLDIRGGETLHGRKAGGLRLAAPGDILLLDSEGNLVVHDELDDLPAYERIRPSDAPAPAAEPAVRPKAVRGGVAPKGGTHDKLANPAAGTTRKRPNPRGER